MAKAEPEQAPQLKLELEQKDGGGSQPAKGGATDTPITAARKAAGVPDGGYGWLIVASSWTILFVFLGQVYAFAVWLPVLQEAFDSGEAVTSAVQSTGMTIMMALGIFNAPMIQTLGYKRASMLGGTIVALAQFLSSFSTSIGMMIATYGVLGGVGYWLLMAPTMAIVNFWFSERRATAVGLAMSGSGVGNAAMGPLITALIKGQEESDGSQAGAEEGWRVVMRIMSALTLVFCVGSASLWKLPPAVVAQLKDKPRAKVQIDTLILKDPVYRVFVACMLGCSLACAQSPLPPALPPAAS